MPKKISRASSQPVSAAAGEGVMSALVDRVFENPANSGGLMVVALTATAIIANAMFLQSSRHSEAVFGHATAVPQAVVTPPLPVAAPVQQQQATAAMPTPPLPRPSPARQQASANTAATSQAVVQPPPPTVAAPIPTAPVAVGLSAADQASLVTALQRELARLGLYTGKIDGKMGSATGAAISSYEKAAGLAATGKPTAALLAMMKTPLPAPPVTAAPPAALAAPATDPITAVTAGQGTALDQRTNARQATIAEQEKQRADAELHAEYRMVQVALNNIAYGPVTVNGQADAETADAIRHFELENGLDLDGQASDAVIARLKAIGAIPAGN